MTVYLLLAEEIFEQKSLNKCTIVAAEITSEEVVTGHIYIIIITMGSLAANYCNNVQWPRKNTLYLHNHLYFVFKNNGVQVCTSNRYVPTQTRKLGCVEMIVYTIQESLSLP